MVSSQLRISRGLIVLIIGLGFFGFAQLASAQEVWNSTDWTLFDTITIDATNIDDDLTDFPVYVDLADLSSTFWSTTPSASSTVGTDVRITTDDGSPTELPRELVFASSTLQTGELHFKADSISSTTDTVFRVYYNGTTTGDYATSSTFGAQNVWSDYDAVWHFDEDPSTTNLADSTSNNNTGTSEGSMTSTDLVDGRVGRAIAFDEVNDRIAVSDDASLSFPNSDWNLSMWVNIDDNVGSQFQYFVSQDTVSTNPNLNIYFGEASQSSVPDVITVNTRTGGDLVTLTRYGDDLNWQHFQIQRESDVISFYKNGVADGQTDADTAALDPVGTLYFGGRNDGNSARYFGGLLDNARFTDRALSQAWIDAEYLNQSTTTDFYTINQGADVWNDVDWTEYDTVTIDSANIDDDLNDFPVYINLSDLSSSFWSTTQAEASLVGTDIRVTTNDGSPTELPRELVSASSTIQTGELHFKAPLISSTTDTTFRIYYNGNTDGDYASSSTYGAQNVWTNDYVAVWHMNESPTGEIIDSTNNSNSATSFGSMTDSDLVTSQLGYGIDFDGIEGAGGDYLLAYPTLPTTDYTYTLWYDPDDVADEIMFMASDGSGGNEFFGRVFTGNLQTFTNNTERVTGSDAISTAGGYYHFSFKRSGSNIAQFVNGNRDGSVSDGTAFSFSTCPLIIGADNDTSGCTDDLGNFTDGVMDEFRIASSARSDEWISAEYLNQSTTTDFYNVGTLNADLTITGTLTEAGVPVVGSNVKLFVGTSTPSIFADTTNGDGEYSFVFANDEIFADDTYLLWVDGETEKASLVGKINSVSGTTTADLEVDTVTLKQEGSSAINISDLANYDSTDDADIQFTASSTLDSFAVLNEQVLLINASTTLELPASTTLSGSLTSDGTISNNGGNIYFTGTNARNTFTGTSNLPDTLITGSYAMVGAVTVDSLTIDTGASVVAPAELTTKGNFTNNGSFNENGGTIVTNSLSYDILQASTSASTSTAGQTGPQEVEFSPDGNKMYIIGGNAIVYEYNLASPFDITTASYLHATSVVAQDTFTEGLAFSYQGHKMYVAGQNTNQIYEYNLTTPWDVSTAVYIQSTSTASQETFVQSLTFSITGHKMYLSGSQGDDFNEYDLTTPWDVSTADYVQNLSPVPSESNPTGIHITPAGDRFFVGGNSLDDVYRFDLSTPFDLSTAVLSSDVFEVPASDTTVVRDIDFSMGGDKLFVASAADTAIFSYQLSDKHEFSGSMVGDNALGNVEIDTEINVFFSDSASTSDITINDFGNVTAPAEDLTVNGDFTNNGKFYANTGNVYLDGGEGFDIFTAEYTNFLDVSGPTFNPTGMVFNNDGTVLYVTDNGDDINWWDLSVPFDISTGVYNSSEDISAQSGGPTGIVFNNDGSKLYVVSSDSDIVTEWDLSVPFDVTTRSLNGTLDVSNEETSPDDLVFSTDGEKLFIIGGGSNFTVGNEYVYEYTLTAPFDITTASYARNFNVTNEDVDPTGLAFSSDGLNMFIVGPNNTSLVGAGYFGPGNEFVNKYSLENPYDISTATYQEQLAISEYISEPSDIIFNNEGTKLYVIEEAEDVIFEFNLGLTGRHKGDFTGDNTGDFYVTDNVQYFYDRSSLPNLFISTSTTLIAPTTTLDIIGDFNNQGSFEANDGTIVLLGNQNTIVGSFASTSSFSNLTISGRYLFESNSSTTGELAIQTNASMTAPYYFSVGGNFSNLGTFDANGGRMFFNSQPYDLREVEYTGESFSFSSQETRPFSVTFNDDGTKMYMLGTTGDDVNEYSLSEPYDVSSASYLGRFSVRDQDDIPVDLEFSQTGNKMFVSGGLTALYEYNLSSNFDLSSASYSGVNLDNGFEPTGFTFKPDGTKLFVLYNTLNKIWAYELGSPFDLSTATHVGEQYDTDGSYDEMAFNHNGTILFIGGSGLVPLRQYVLTSPYDISSAEDSGVFMTGFTDIVQSPSSIVFGDDFSKIFIVNEGFSRDRSVHAFSLPGKAEVSGSLVADSSFHDLELVDNARIVFGNSASTTGEFKNISAGHSSVEFNSGDTYTFDNINLAGVNKQSPIYLGPTINGDEWFIEVTGSATATRLYIQDSNACGSGGGGLVATTSVDGGGNTCWSFAVGDTVGITGTLYSDLGVSPITSTETIGLVIGGVFIATTTSDISGDYSFALEAEDLFLNETITLFTTESSVSSSLITKATSSESNISNLNLYQNFIHLLTTDSGANVIGLNSFSYYDQNTNPDLNFVASTSNNSFETGIGQSLFVSTTTTFVSPASTTIDGSFINLGTYINDQGTTTLSGLDKVVFGNYIGSSELFNLVIDGTYEFLSNASTTNLIISTNASMTAPELLTVKSSFENNGVFDANGGMLYFTGNNLAFDNIRYTNQTENFTSQDSNVLDIAISGDGLILYILGENTDTVYSYSLETPFNLSTTTYTGDSFIVGSQESTPTGLDFAPDGSKMFVVGPSSDAVYAYDLSVNWDISTAQYNSENLDISDWTYSADDITFNSTGDKLFITDDYEEYGYNLSTPYDLTTGSYSGESFAWEGHFDIKFNDDGTRLFAGSFDGTVLEYSFSPYNFNSFDFSGPSNSYSFPELSGGTIQGMFFDNYGFSIFLLDSLDNVYKYDIATQPAIAGNLVAGSALHDLTYISEGPLSFQTSASTTGTFYVAEPGSQLNFNAGDTYTFENFVIATGTINNLTSLVSNSSGTEYFLEVNNASVPFLYLQDSNACQSTGGGLEAVLSEDGGNNTCWTFSLGPNTIFSGTIYTDLGTTPLTDNPTLRLIALSDAQYSSSTVADGSGTYSVGLPQLALEAGVPIVGYLDTNGSSSATVVTMAGDNQQNVSDLDLYLDTVILRSEDVNSPLELSSLEYDVNDDSDLLYELSANSPFNLLSSTSTGVYVWKDSVLSFNRNLFIQNGDLTTATNTTLKINNDVYLDGSLSVSVGTQFIGDGKIVFTSTSTGETVSGVLTGTSSLPHIIFSGEGGEYVFANNASTSNLTNSSSTIVAPNQLTIGGQFENTGSFESSSGTIFVEGNPYYINTAEPEYSFSVSSEDSAPNGLVFKSDGSKVYIIGNSSDSIYAYDLSVAWELSSASYNGEFYSVASEDTNQGEVAFKTDGTKMYITGTVNDTIYAYDLSIPWDVSTASYNSESLLVTDQQTYPSGITFRPDGLQLYIIGDESSLIHSYNLSIPWDVSTASYSNDSLVTSQQSLYPYGLEFNSDGSKVFVAGCDAGNLYEYNLAIKYDISTAEYTGDFFDPPEDSCLLGVRFDDTGSRMYITGTSDSIHQYNLLNFEFDGDLVGASALNNLIKQSNLSLNFNSSASTTGTFTATTDATSTITFNASSTYTFENIDWQGSEGGNLILQSSASGTPWYLDVPGTRTIEYVQVQDSDAASTTGGTIVANNSIDLGNNFNWSFESVEVFNATTTLTDHPDTQVNNNFNFQNKTNEPLFAFRMEDLNATSTITELVLTLSGVKEVFDTDFSNIRLWRDTDNDAEYDASDTELSTGVMSITGDEGTITFSTTFTSSTSANYLVTADWNAPDRSSSMNINLYGDNITATDIDGTHDFIGEVRRAQHNRLARRSGGGGSNTARVGTPAPPGDGDVTGGTNDGGEQIGSNPNYSLPTNNTGGSNPWTNPENAYDGIDGTYASANTAASSSFQNHNFSVAPTNSIEGVEIKLEVSGTTGAGTIDVELSYDGGTSWTTVKTTPTLTTTDTVVTLGGPSDTWDRSWTSTEFSNANFRVRLTASPSANTVQVDAIQVRVYNQATGGGSGGGGRT